MVNAYIPVSSYYGVLVIMRMQRTIKKAVQCSGIGLHSGERVEIRLVPAPEDTGIVFIKRTKGVAIPLRASGDKVVGTQLCTSIGENGTSVQTVEHLLSTLSGLEIDNLFIEVDASELPILDGSAGPFLSMILEAGTVDQGRPQAAIRVVHPVEIRDGDKFIILHPADHQAPAPGGYSIDCTIRFDRPIQIHQTRRYVASPNAYVREIAHARTFGFLNEVEWLRSNGLAKGGSLDNAVVVSEEGVINPEGLRFKDEFIRHKILDLVGDLSLLGKPLIAHVEAFCPGHQLNTRLVSKLLEETGSWVLDEVAVETKKSGKSRVPQLVGPRLTPAVNY